MVQWKWVNIGLGLLVVLCAVVCWKDTASGIRMVAAIREWCQSTRSADHHRVLPLVPPRPDSGTATVESQPKQLSASAQTIYGHLDWANNIAPMNYIMNSKTFNVVLLVLLLMVVEKNGFKDDRFA